MNRHSTLPLPAEEVDEAVVVVTEEAEGVEVKDEDVVVEVALDEEASEVDEVVLLPTTST